MTSKRFEGHEQAAAKINYYNDGSFELVSYSTTVITVDKEGWLHITTIKHIGWFMKMCGLSYQTAKQLLMDNKNMNIYTGEVIDWE